jgi:class 3 adenylate cyclase/uncharacterized protein HemY
LSRLKEEIAASEDDKHKASLSLIVGWLAGERGDHAEAQAHFQSIAQFPALAGWALVGQAFIALREKDYERAHQLLDGAATKGTGGNSMLLATATHCRGAVCYHQGRFDEALVRLHEALGLFGTDHFAAGRVLDTLGMVYASKNNFQSAREFYEKAIEHKRRFQDEASTALRHGQLGRLHLDFGDLNRADKHFQDDLEISERIGDKRGVAQMYNHLGQVALARQQWQKAAGWLDESIRLSQEGEWPILEGYARKDRALASLALGKHDEAETQLQLAARLFQERRFAEGDAYVNRSLGMLWRAEGRHEESTRVLRAALAYFSEHGEAAQAARTQLEIARTLRARNAPRALVIDALVKALDRAERCRRSLLMQEIEEELKATDEAEYCRHIYRRARGHGIDADTVSLLSGERAVATVMFLDLKGSIDYVRSNDPEVVLMTLNQMMADFAAVLERYQVAVTQYLGDGFMALVRDANHAERAVNAALDLVSALREFNPPREILGLPQLHTRIGISTGAVMLGNVGTYRKIDFTAIGTTTNLAARLQSEAEPLVPCISRATFEEVGQRFTFKAGSPRKVTLKGLTVQEVWDVAGRAPPAEERFLSSSRCNSSGSPEFARGYRSLRLGRFSKEISEKVESAKHTVL